MKRARGPPLTRREGELRGARAVFRRLEAQRGKGRIVWQLRSRP